MKKYTIYCYLLALLLCSNWALSQTVISGEIYDGKGGPLTLSGSPYYVRTSSITIPEGKTLTIEPGVVVRFEWPHGLEIIGTLKAEGLSGSKITFTKDTVKGSVWQSILMRAGSEAYFKYCVIDSGGLNGFPMINIQSPKTLSLENCEIRSNQGAGLGGDAGLANSSAITILNSTIELNEKEGIDLRNGDFPSSYEISDNVMKSNKSSAFLLSPGIYPMKTTYQSNGYDGIEVRIGIAKYSGTYECDIVVKDGFTIEKDVTVTFTPGKNIFLSRSNVIDVSGNIVALGSGDKNINFQRNGNADIWSSIILRQESSGKFSYCNFDGGGIFGFPMINLQSPKEFLLENSNFTNSSGGGVDGSIGNIAGKLTITNCNFKNNVGNGLGLTKGDNPVDLIIDKNFFEKNEKSALLISCNIYPTNSTFHLNGFDGIQITSQTPTVKISGIFENNLLIPGFYVDKGTTVTLKPGITVYVLQDGLINVSGSLIAEGTQEKYIRFISKIIQENWMGIGFTPGSTSSLKYCEVTNVNYQYGALDIGAPKKLTIDHCLIHDNNCDAIYGNCGVGNDTSDVEIIGSFIYNNSKNGILLGLTENGSKLKMECNYIFNNLENGLRCAGKISLANNSFFGNTLNGLNNFGFDSINAKNNWWGDPSGPGGIGTGTGDKIEELTKGTVVYEPFATQLFFTACGDIYDPNAQPNIYSIIEGDTLYNGNVRRFTITGNNFQYGLEAFMSKGNHGEPNPGDIAAKIVLFSPQLLILDFDLNNDKIIANWDLVIKNPNNKTDKKIIYILPSVNLYGYLRYGMLVYPIMPEEIYGQNYLKVVSLGTEAGYMVLEFIPPAPGAINMKIYSDGTEIWNSKDVADNTKALIFVKLDLYNEITYALHWNVPPEKVIWPSIIPYFENKGNKNQIMGDDPNDDLVILGEGKQFTVKGATGAAKSKMKGMVLDAFLKVSCGGLAEYINGEEWNKMLNNAIDRVLEDLPKNFTQTLEYIIKEIVGEIVDTFVKAGAVKVAEIVGGCLKDFVTGVVNGWIIKQNEYKKQEADIMRIHKQEYQRAIEKMNERSKTSDQGTLRKQELEYLNHANEPVCTPAPWLRLDEKGTVITPSKDPNSKDAEGDFYTSFEPKGDTTNPVYLLSQKNIDKPIKYTIHFENMSDAFGAATFVSIIDTLSSNLDLNTLEIDTSASRYKYGDFKWSLKDNILKFHYRYINLPPNKVPPEGMWQTVYSIKPKKDLKLGTKILNRASIVFDANPAIVTPTTTHIIGAPKIAASTKLLDFGSLDINKSLIDTITIYNIGEYPLTINTISGLDKPFSIISNNCSGSELLPNDSCKMLVKFQIEKSDIFIDTLKIRSNDLSDYPFQIITKGYESGVSVKELIPPSKKYYIYECAPNPFYLTTSIKYYLPVSSKVSLKVYNFCGQLLRTLVDEIETEGIKQIFWDGLTFEEESVPNGVYFIHIEANDIKNHNHKFKDVIQVIKLK